MNTIISTCFRCGDPTVGCVCDQQQPESDRLDYLTPEGRIDPSRIWCPDCGADEWCPAARAEAVAEATAAPEIQVGVAAYGRWSR